MTDDIGHEEIALSYLINDKGLSQHEALNIIENVNLFSYAYEGLYVWNSYENGFYGSFITKGEADKTPNDIKKLAKRAFKARINALLIEKQKLTEKIKMLEAEKRGSSNNYENNAEKSSREKLLSDKKRKLKEEAKRNTTSDLNQINYKLLNFDFAKRKGIITETVWDGVKLVKSRSIDYSRKVDFSDTDNLIVKPRHFGLKTFTEIYVFPRSLVATGAINVIRIDRLCRLEFVDKANLRNKNIVIIAK